MMKPFQGGELYAHPAALVALSPGLYFCFYKGVDFEIINCRSSMCSFVMHFAWEQLLILV